VIAKLKGIVDSVDTDSVIVDVGGVGYLVAASARTLRDLAAGGAVTVLVETIVREDAIALYGFLETAERDWFRILTTVQGVGARVALSILSTLSPDEIARAIAAQDRATLSRPAGVGPKLAARLATELKDKAAAFGIAPAAHGVRAGADAPAAMQAGSVNEDAVSALVNLGYKRIEAFGAVARVTQRLGGEARLDAVIRAGLQELAR
jgi:Holliday junction DNA helicase RuvA